MRRDVTVDVRDRTTLATSPAREAALDALESGIAAAHPRRVVAASVSLSDDSLVVADAAYDLREYDEVLVLGGGNAAGQVALALETALADLSLPLSGAVVTDDPADTDRVEVLPGDHPVPSERGEAGARRVLELARAAGPRTLVLAVITGGGSALLPAPAGELTLEALQRVTERLLESGATIHEMNAVRKHLSAIKGGGLARAAAPARVVGLLFSDVVGDDHGVIASGPVAPDSTTYEEALDVLERYGLPVPDAVTAHLRAGVAGDVPETPRPADSAFDRVTRHVLADNGTALRAAATSLADAGYEPLVLTSRVRGESREAAKTHVAVAEEIRATGTPLEPPAAVLTGGETTVTVRGDGRGGPNQEFALSAALELATGGEGAGIVVASVDTDGIDGATDVAGALVDATVADPPREARRALDGNDAYPFLDAVDALVETGRTGTNVNDLRLLLVDPA